MASGTAPQPGKYRRIGEGVCGSVWTPDSEDDPFFGYAFKREDGLPARSLRKEFDNHSLITSLLRQFVGITSLTDPDSPRGDASVRVTIPYCYRLLERHSAEYWVYWEEHKAKFPRVYVRCTTLQTERIPSMPKDVRNLLIDTFCPKSLVQTVKASDSNADCLIRPYLGRRRFRATEDKKSDSLSAFPGFSLHNFPLHLDQMEKLKIPLPHIFHMATMMGEALAMIHWLAELDGNDIEFLLAPPRSGNTTTSKCLSDNVLGNYALWLLDFDNCNHITMDQRGVDQAAAAFLRNDPYYPHVRASAGLFKGFSEMYMGASGSIIRHRRLGGDMVDQTLPERFLFKICEGNRKKFEKLWKDSRKAN